MFPRGEIAARCARGRALRALRARWRGFVARAARAPLRSGRRLPRDPEERRCSRSRAARRVRASYAPPVRARGSPGCSRTSARGSRRARVSRFERNHALVRFLAHRARRRRARRFASTPSARARLGRRARRGRRAPIAIHPGTSDATPHKRWSAAGYAAVARALRDDDGAPLDRALRPRAGRARARRGDRRGGGRRGAPRAADARRSATSPRCSRAAGSTSAATPDRCTSRRWSARRWCRSSVRPIRSRTRRAPDTPSRTVRVPVACSPCRRGCAAATCMRASRRTPWSLAAARAARWRSPEPDRMLACGADR